MSDNDGAFMNTRGAAAWLGLSPCTLDGYRVSGARPVSHRFDNQPRNRKADLETWAAEPRAVTTAEADRLKPV